METHSNVQFSVWFVRNLKHDRACEQIQSHAGYLRNVIITYSNKVSFKINSDIEQTILPGQLEDRLLMSDLILKLTLCHMCRQ